MTRKDSRVSEVTDLPEKYRNNALLSVTTIVGTFTPHNMCPNSSNAEGMARNALAYIVKEFWLAVDGRELDAAGA